MNHFINCITQKYATFSGRATREEFWMYILFLILAAIVVAGVDIAFGTFGGQYGTGLFSSLFDLALLLPTLAVMVRRLHDTDHRGWWVLVLLIPLVGWLVLLYFFGKASDEGENRFGAVAA